MISEKPDTDEKRFNETLKRMLKTPPKPHEGAKRKDSLTESTQKQKPGGPPAKNDRPEVDD
jgi:hypothetical protein